MVSTVIEARFTVEFCIARSVVFVALFHDPPTPLALPHGTLNYASSKTPDLRAATAAGPQNTLHHACMCWIRALVSEPP